MFIYRLPSPYFPFISVCLTALLSCASHPQYQASKPVMHSPIWSNSHGKSFAQSQQLTADSAPDPSTALLEQEAAEEQLDQEQLVGDEEQSYTEKDRAEDIVEKLLTEERPSDDGQQLDSGFFTPRTDHPLVKKWVHFFVNKDRARFSRFIYNGTKYRDDIETILAEEGVPKELFFVGLIESGYFLLAKSHASAVGPWQFIRATGKRYGLLISRQLDERQDLYKATRAAARYFKDLYRIFGSWELSLSAYNAGEYGIMRRMKRARTEDFFALATNGHLHRETANYVPKVMAVMHIYKHLESYGFQLPNVENPFQASREIKLFHAQRLSKLALQLGTSVATLKGLNPELKGNVTPYLKKRPYLLRVPRYTATGKMELAQKESFRRSIAQTETQSVEQILSSSTVQAKKKSNTQSTAYKKPQWNTYKSQDKGVLIKNNLPFIYKVKPGESLQEIAQIFKVSAKELQHHNQLRTTKLLKGQKIKLPRHNKTYYVVQRGENLMVIAKKLGTNVALLKHLNDSSKDGQVYAGQKLLVVIN